MLRKELVAMTLDAVPVVALFVATILIVMLPMEGGYRLGRMAHRRNRWSPPSRVPCLRCSRSC